jgi:hypothetical protein
MHKSCSWSKERKQSLRPLIVIATLPRMILLTRIPMTVAAIAAVDPVPLLPLSDPQVHEGDRLITMTHDESGTNLLQEGGVLFPHRDMTPGLVTVVRILRMIAKGIDTTRRGETGVPIDVVIVVVGIAASVVVAVEIAEGAIHRL